jgi:hypothetical protein
MPSSGNLLRAFWDICPVAVEIYPMDGWRTSMLCLVSWYSENCWVSLPGVHARHTYYTVPVLMFSWNVLLTNHAEKNVFIIFPDVPKLSRFSCVNF